MLQRIIFGFSLCLLSASSVAQSVGINTSGLPADASAMLDVVASDKGILIPRISLTATNLNAPVAAPVTGLLVYNTNTTGGITGVNPGFYSWAAGTGWQRLFQGNDGWRLGGNSLVATGSLGTISNNHIDLITNNSIRGRLTNLGEFFIGTTNTAVPGDLMSAVSNATFPFATNGYSAFNGSGVYGAITGGNTSFAAVQGEYQSTAPGTFNTAGVRGLNQSTTAGTGFRTQAATGPRVGVIGATSATAGQYTFGLHGSMNSTDIRCGAVIGDDFGIALGALAYYAANLADYSVYGFGGAYQVGVAGGRHAAGRTITEPNTHIGLGIYGGVMGGWIRGLVYGQHVKGERYSLYVDGKAYTNEPITELITTADGQRLPAYSLTALTTDVYARGKAVLQNGEGFISFDKDFAALISSNPDDIIITVSPVGQCKGVYIARQNSTGFVVKENDGGTSNVSLNWIAIASRKDGSTMHHSPELLRADFDTKMNGVMFNDNNTKDKPQPLWWDGGQIRFDIPPAKQVDTKPVSNSRVAEKI